MNVPSKRDDAKNHPLAYWASPGRFNLTALLQTGRFYLDETGLLVSPNGTRYRIPSGPPEGRKPLRPDRPSFEGFEISKQKDLTSIEQQDSNKLHQWSLAKLHDQSEVSSDKSVYSPLDHSNLSSSVSRLIGSDGTLKSIPPIAAQMDWNVILLTVILSSIALVCNLVLVIFLSWKIDRFHNGFSRTVHSTLSHRGHTNPLVHIHATSVDDGKLEQCTCVQDRAPVLRSDRSIRKHLVADSGTCTTRLVRQEASSPNTELSKRYRHRRVRRRRRPIPNRQILPEPLATDPLSDQKCSLFTNPKSHLLTTEMSLLNDLGQATPFISPSDRIEVGSSSGGSWQVVVSDGMISETTADEEDNDENSTTGIDSATNLDKFYHDRRHTIRSRKSNHCRRFHRSGSTPNDLGRLSEIDGSMLRSSAQRTKTSRLDTIRSDCVAQCDHGRNSCSESTLSGEVQPFRSVFLRYIQSSGTTHVCYSLGIHFGLLGVVLSLIQLIVVCSALSRRMLDSHNPAVQSVHQSGSHLSELVCVLATSLAADTLLCARQYVLAAMLLVFWTTSYMALVGTLQPDSSHVSSLRAFCLASSRSDHDPDTDRPHTGRRQQRYAYLALTHSLPWAVAAGTALLISFVLPFKNPDVVASKSPVTLNLFFHGLDSLLTCDAHDGHLIRLTTESAGSMRTSNVDVTMQRMHINNTSPTITDSWFSTHWLVWSLLILIPLCIHVLLCVVYSIAIWCGMRRAENQKGLRHQRLKTTRVAWYVFGSLLALISLEYLSCAVPVLWSMFSLFKEEHGRSSSYVYRLIILHLVIDPWLIACIIRPIMTRIVESACRSHGSHNTETRTGQWTNTSPVQVDLHSSAFRSEQGNISSRPISSVGMINCFPMSSRFSKSNSRTYTLPPNGQTMLMPCVPTTNFYVSPLQPISDSTGVDANLLVSLDNPSVRLSSSQSESLQPGRYAANLNSLSMSTTLANPILDPIQPFRNTNTDVFPQLCEHHQKLLEQHYTIRLPCAALEPNDTSTTTMAPSHTGSVRAFGQVPRISPANLNFTDYLTKSVMQQSVDESPTIEQNNSNTGTMPQNHPILEHSPSSDEPGKQFSNRPAGGKSQATAAVMAAAAAAVAAQAGTMSHTSTDQTITDFTSHPLLSHSAQQQSTRDGKLSPSYHSSLSTTVQLTTHNNDLVHP